MLYSTWVIQHPCKIPQKGVIRQHAICHTICQAMTPMRAAGNAVQIRLYSRPRHRWQQGGRQRNACAADSLLLRAAAHWTSHCEWPAAALHVAGRAAGIAEWTPAFLHQDFGCGRTGNSHHSGFEVAAQPCRLALGAKLVVLGPVGEKPGLKLPVQAIKVRHLLCDSRSD